MRKILAFVLVFAFAFFACAEIGVPYAGKGADMKTVEILNGNTYQADGSYTAVSFETSALIRLFQDKIATYAGGGMVYAYVSLEGNRDTGICYPCLNILYAGSSALNAEYVMFVVGDVRYDVRVSSSVKQHGRYKVETMKAFLSEEGLEMIEKLNGAEEADITILGSDQYRQTLDTTANYASQKYELAGKSLSGLRLPSAAPDFDAYALSDLAETAFEKTYGIETVYAVSNPGEKCAIQTDKVFGLIADGASTVSIRAMQELLVKKGFMAGTATTAVNAGMITSVKNAQAYYGLPETGYADAKLVNLLNAGEAAVGSAQEEASFEASCENGNIALSVDRWWTAKRVETTVPGGGKSVSDKSNVFMIADGYVKSSAVKNLSLSWEVTCEMVLDGKWTFPANLFVETQAGEAFSANLGMLSEGRMVIVCEVPENAVDAGDWALVIREGADTFEFSLDR